MNRNSRDNPFSQNSNKNSASSNNIKNAINSDNSDNEHTSQQLVNPAMSKSQNNRPFFKLPTGEEPSKTGFLYNKQNSKLNNEIESTRSLLATVGNSGLKNWDLDKLKSQDSFFKRNAKPQKLFPMTVSDINSDIQKRSSLSKYGDML